MRIEITTPYLLQYRTNEVISLVKMMVNRYKEETDLPEVLAKQVAKLEEWNTKLEKEYKKKRKNTLTGEMAILDKERKAKIKAVKWFLESQQFRESPEKVEAATYLLTKYRQDGKSIERANYTKVTSLLEELTGLWLSDAQTLKHLQTLDIVDWVQNIQNINESFFQKKFERTLRENWKGNCYPLKVEVKALYEKLLRDTFSFIYIAEGDHPFVNVIANIDGFIKKHNLSYNIRQGIKKSKKRREGQG